MSLRFSSRKLEILSGNRLKEEAFNIENIKEPFCNTPFLFWEICKSYSNAFVRGYMKSDRVKYIIFCCSFMSAILFVLDTYLPNADCYGFHVGAIFYINFIILSFYIFDFGVHFYSAIFKMEYLLR